MKYIPGLPTIDNDITEAKEPIPISFVSRGGAAVVLHHEINAELFWPEDDFNFHQIPPDKVAIGIAWSHEGVNFAGILATKTLFNSFFNNVKERRLRFQCMWAEREKANEFFNKWNRQ